MKLQKLIMLALVVAFATACENSETPSPQQESILPESFSVNIPESISNEYMTTARMYSNAKAQGDTLQGNDIYEHLGNFINIGEGAGEIVEDIITGIIQYNINKPMVFSYEGDEDGRTKNLEVIESSFYQGEEWEYRLTITDALNESNPDGGKALQIFWNRSPIKGVALLKPANIDADDNSEFVDAVFSIEYSEAGEHGYEANMIVSIVEMPLADPLEDPYSVKSLKLFAGRNGDFIDVYGNSDHPNAIFFSGEVGFNWAFVAAGYESEDIGVAEVGLPPSNLDEPGRDVLLDFYSIKNVFTREINAVWPWLEQDILDAYLFNTEGPGYFNEDGFMMGGTSPGAAWDVLAERLEALSPYNPKEISTLTVEFQ
jgi:hypothetical protein